MPESELVEGAASGLLSLVTPCPQRLDPARPASPVDGAPVGLALSGGGFRATLAGLGVVQLLEDVGLLPRLRFVSSVSGGSVAAASLATQWPAIRAGASLRDRVVEPIVTAVSSKSMKLALVRNLWRTVGPMNRTELLARMFDTWWLDGALLEELDPQVRWVFNAANASSGTRFGFERDLLGDYVVGRIATAGTRIKVATAAAASAAVPGVFPPLSLPGSLQFPCGSRGRPLLVDGGAYDNTGLEVLDSERYDGVFTVVLNAGGILQVDRRGWVPIVRDLQRANSLLYRQSTALRTRSIVPLFREYEAVRDNAAHQPGGRRRAGILFDLASDIADKGNVDAFRARFPEHRSWPSSGNSKDLAFVPTVFDKLERGLCDALVYRGWWLTGAGLAAYHPDLINIDRLVAPT